MAVRNTKGLKVYLEKASATPVTKDGTNGGTTLTAIAANTTTTTHTDLTVDAVVGITAGDVVELSGTGFAELDGKSFTVVSAATTTVVINADLTGSTGSLDAATCSAVFTPVTQLDQLCLSSIGVNADTPSSVAVPTFCDPSASVAGTTASAGTLDFSGYLDTADAGFAALAAAEEDGNERLLLIQFPGDGGNLIAHGTISSFYFSDIPIDGAVAYSSQMTLASKPEHRYN